MKKLLAKDPTRLGQPAGKTHPSPDPYPLEFADGTPTALREKLEALLGKDQVRARTIDLVRYASDASHYRLFPQVVVSPRTESDVIKLHRFCREEGHHLTFRAGGSSLNGQSLSDDILVDVRSHFRGMVVNPDTITVKPGETLINVLAVLNRKGRKIGPDPASSSIATIGGILSNNSGGMRCRVDMDSYHSIRQMRIILPSGTVVDTRDPNANERLRDQEPEIYNGLLALKSTIENDAELKAKIRRKFTIRNTNALRLDAFLDFDTPVDILMHLMIGAEGILGFIAEAEIATVAHPKMAAVTWVMMPKMDLAANYVDRLVKAGAESVELLASPAMREAVGSFPGAHEDWLNLPEEMAALLLEVAADDEESLQAKMQAARDALQDADLLQPLDFMREPTDIKNAWEIRAGLVPLAGAKRDQGCSLITEDVCYPPERIGEATKDLLALLDKYNYPLLVMGHATFGNLHFCMTPNFEVPEEVERYDHFLQEFAEMTLDKYEGSLKAEHGTGVNMAPFVQREWGETAFNLMWKIKELLDPHGILAPDIKLTRDQKLHIKNFKSHPKIEDIANPCVECGFCESVCPSRHLTTTPRQRIVIRREMARQPEDSPLLTNLLQQNAYDGINTCAVDSSCYIACPISIDTGKMVKLFRQMEQTRATEKVALTLAQHWDKVEVAGRAGLTATDAVTKVLGDGLGTRALGLLTDAVRQVIDPDLMYTAREGLPPAATWDPPRTTRKNAAAVYFPACINRMFGDDHGSIAHTLVNLSARAGQPLWIPEVDGLCCGTPFSSKGFKDAKEYMADKLREAILEWTDGGRLPVVCDAASCTHGIVENIPDVNLLDAVEWAHSLLPHLTVSHKLDNLVIHPTCSMQHLGIVEEFADVAQSIASHVEVPLGAHCCGTAGDRGLLHPELTEAATLDERAGIASFESEHGPADAYASANRTCEMGLNQHSGKDYQHIIYLLEKATR